MRVNNKPAAFVQIIIYLYFIFCNAFVFSFPAVAETRPEKVNENKNAQAPDEQGKDLATTLSSAGSLLSQDNRMDAVINSLVNSTTQGVSNEMQNWLQAYGTARVNIGVDRNFSLNSADADLLLPLYDSGPHLIFSQTGVRRSDDRNLMNLGVGYRHFSDSWMWGINTFYDQQLSDNTHQRLGVGGELEWDYFKLSANGYARLSGWKNSTRHEDFQERVANGYDLRAEGYLPAWPQLGMQLMWEQYYGRDVALFGDDQDQRQRDPYAVTAGINYTPFPLMTLGINQKEGKGNKHESQAEMNINWVIGAPFAEQIDTDSVNSKRTLRGGRLDLVSRNNNIVLEYRKKELISLSLPEHITGDESQTLPLAVKITSKYPLSHIDWQDAGLVSHGGKIINSSEGWSVFLPAYQQNGAHKNVYVMSATAYDSKGNQSDKAWVTVEVKGYNLLTATTKTTTSTTNLIADGVSSTPVLLTITSGTGQPIGGVADNLSTELIHSQSETRPLMLRGDKSAQESMTAWQEQSPGVYVSTYTSGVTPGKVTIQPKYKNTLLSKATLTLVAANSVVHFAGLDAAKLTALADGKDEIALSVKVEDDGNNPLQGVEVRWQTGSATAHLSAPSATTDDKGVARITVTSSAVEALQVSATVSDSTQSSPQLSFTVDSATANVSSLKTDKIQATSNDVDRITLSAKVVDASGHPLSAPLKWMVVQGQGTLSAAETVADAQGESGVTLTSVHPGTVVVSASSTAGVAVNSAELTFIADSLTAQVAGLMVSKATAVANGVDSVTVTGLITDTFGQPLSNVSAAWSVTPATGVLSATTSVSDAQGKIAVVLKSTEIATYQVTARVAADEETSEPLTFKADTTTAAIHLLTADKTAGISAGRDTVTLTAEVKDGSGLPIEGATVNWSGDNAKGVFSADSTSTDSSGKAVVTYQSTLAMTTNIVAKMDAGSQKSLAITLVPDLQSAAPGTVTTDKTSATANGDDVITIMTTVKDQYGNPVVQQAVDWSVLPALDFQLSASTQLTDAAGESRITMTSTDRGIFKATASFNSQNKTSSPFGFASDTATEKVASIVASKTTGVVAGKDTVTLLATITDDDDNLVANAVVYWGSDNDSGVFTSDSVSTTNMYGVAEITYTATAALPTIVGAGINHSRKTLTLSYIGDESTPHLVAIKADKKSAVADGKEQVTWTTRVQDGNGNSLPGVTVDWGSSRPELSFSATSSVTDAQGNASVQGYSTRSGDVIATATLPATQQTLSAEKVTFKGDEKTAEVYELIADKKHAAANNGDQIKLTATVHDHYGNPVPNMQVQWSTSLNTLSAATSQTDAQGITSVMLSGQEDGRVNVTAKTATGSTVMQISDIIFANMIEDTWVINGTSSQYSSAAIKGFPSLGFVTISPTQGPVNLSWGPSGYSDVSTPVTLTGGNGQQYTIKLKGYRQSACSTRPLNAAVSCGSNAGMKAKFIWAQTDNPSLPAGHYTGVVSFAGKDWHTSYAFYYKLTLDLTVN